MKIDAVYLENSDLYEQVLLKHLREAKRSIDIATATLKDTRIKDRRRVVSITRVFEDLVRRGVTIRLLHASNPSAPFEKQFRNSVLPAHAGFIMRQCKRLHFKMILIDGTVLYLGSANLTGAGMGMKSEENRNFEIGFLHKSPEIIAEVSKFFELIWDGEFCHDCGRRSICPEHIK